MSAASIEYGIFLIDFDRQSLLSSIDDSKPAPYIFGSSMSPIRPYSTLHQCKFRILAISDNSPTFFCISSTFFVALFIF